MAYSDRPINRVVETASPVAVGDYHDRVRWGPILGGLVVALSTQLVLTGLGAAIGLTTYAGADAANAADVGRGVGIWSIVSLLISLFVGGWVTSRACGPINRSTALLNGAILWATTLAISAWLLASGVSGAFGVIASNAADLVNQAQQGGVTPQDVNPDVTNQEARNIAGDAAKAGWSFALGSLLGLAASLIGASIGARTPRVVATTTNTVTH